MNEKFVLNIQEIFERTLCSECMCGRHRRQENHKSYRQFEDNRKLDQNVEDVLHTFAPCKTVLRTASKWFNNGNFQVHPCFNLLNTLYLNLLNPHVQLKPIHTSPAPVARSPSQNQNLFEVDFHQYTRNGCWVECIAYPSSSLVCK